MNKTIIFFAFLVVFIAYTKATIRPVCRPVCRRNQDSEIRCVKDENGCRKMRKCSIDEENCFRRHRQQKLLRQTSHLYCRHIKGTTGAGPCAPVRWPRNARPDCHRLPCTDQSKSLNCYRSKQNSCQLLTPCQLARVNCARGRNNSLTWTTERQCRGMRNGQSLRKCRRT